MEPLEHSGVLPADDDFSRLRVLVCDPGTIYAYWQAGQWRGDGWRVRVVRGSTVLQEQELAPETREIWAHPAPDTHGHVVLQTRRGQRWETVAKAPFHTPTDRPRPPASTPRFVRFSGGPCDFVPRDNPELEDVVMRARRYHGKIWSAADEGGES